MIVEGIPEAIQLQGAVHSERFKFPWEKKREGRELKCAHALQRIFSEKGVKGIKEVLGIAAEAWGGEKLGVSNAMLGALWIILTQKRKPDIPSLCRVLAGLMPDTLIAEGRGLAASRRCGSVFGTAELIRKYYDRAVDRINRIGVDLTAQKVIPGRATKGGSNRDVKMRIVTLDGKEVKKSHREIYELVKKMKTKDNLYKNIAKELGMSEDVLCWIMQNGRVEDRLSPIIGEIKKEFMSGKTRDEIVAKYNIPISCRGIIGRIGAGRYEE